MSVLRRISCWLFGHYWCFTVKVGNDTRYRRCCGICDKLEEPEPPDLGDAGAGGVM